MTVADAIKKAVEERNALMAGRCADLLREHGYTYQQVFETANKLTGISAADWETLMYLADTESGG